MLFFIYNLIKEKGGTYMDILKIINDETLKDVPILDILKVINTIQKESINEESCRKCQRIYSNNESVKEGI